MMSNDNYFRHSYAVNWVNYVNEVFVIFFPKPTLKSLEVGNRKKVHVIFSKGH